MDNEEFLRRLSEVSEWHRPMLGPNGCYSVNKNAKKVNAPRQLTEQEIMDLTDEEAQRYYDELVAWRETQPNDSIQPEILKVKVQATDCTDCGQHCPTGRRVEKKIYESGSRHWRERCFACDRYRDPITKQFTVNMREAHQYFTDFYKPKQGKYKSKYQQNKPPKPTLPPPPPVEPVPVSVKKTYWLLREHGDSVIRELRSIEIIEMRKPKR